MFNPIRSLSISPLHKPGRLRIINIAGDCIIPDALHRIVNHKTGHEEPFARHDRIAETILDFNIRPGWTEDTMDQIFQPDAIDVVERVGSDNLDIRHKEGCIEPGIGKTAGNLATGYANLVQHITVGSNKWMVGFAAKDIDGAAGYMHTVSGLLHADYRLPSMDDIDILKAALALTRSMPDVEALFRPACFNVFGHNRDDHAKNVSLLMEDNGLWHTAPAYDLTFSAGLAGEHSTTIMGEGKKPARAHLQAPDKKTGLKNR